MGIQRLEVRGDSNLAISQINGDFDAKDPKMAAYRNAILKMSARFEGLEFHHVARENNQGADILSLIPSHPETLTPDRTHPPPTPTSLSPPPRSRSGSGERTHDAPPRRPRLLPAGLPPCHRVAVISVSPPRPTTLLWWTRRPAGDEPLRTYAPASSPRRRDADVVAGAASPDYLIPAAPSSSPPRVLPRLLPEHASLNYRAL